jgi:hypothetical protein
VPRGSEMYRCLLPKQGEGAHEPRKLAAQRSANERGRRVAHALLRRAPIIGTPHEGPYVPFERKLADRQRVDKLVGG